MKAKKTFSVEQFKNKINMLIAYSTEDTDTARQKRKTLAAILGGILHETGNYHGFNYVAWIDEGGCEQWRKDGEPKDNEKYLGDQTRVRFY